MNEDLYLPSLEKENDIPISLLADHAPRTSSPRGITDDVLVSANPPTALNSFCEFDVGEQSNTVGELDISIKLSLVI